MGLFDGYSTVGTPSRSHSYHGRTTHSPSARSTRSGGGYYTRPSYARSSSSFFGGGNGNGSTSRGWGGGSFFGGSRSGGSSYYKRRPRDGYISYLLHRLQRMIKELWYYARKHPMKAFFAIVVPLLSAGGALHGLLKQLGIRLPMGLMDLGRGGLGGSEGFGGFESERGGGGWMDNAGNLISIVRAFT